MAKKTQTREEPADSVLAAAAKTVGKAARKVASAVAGPPQVDAGGNNQEQQAPKVSRKVPKLAKKNKQSFAATREKGAAESWAL
jgi:hypothetical protein